MAVSFSLGGLETCRLQIDGLEREEKKRERSQKELQVSVGMMIGRGKRERDNVRYMTDTFKHGVVILQAL